MMTIIIILAYIASIFLARWFNKLCNKIDDLNDPIPLIWFIPFFGMASYFLYFIFEYYKSTKSSNWFIGKNW